MDGVDLYAQRDQAHEEALHALVKQGECAEASYKLGVKSAEAERKYRIEKHKRILYERANNNTPVSIISDVVKGYEDIAQLALERDCARAEEQANRDAQFYWREVEQLHKKREDVLGRQIEREYGQKS